MLIADIKLQLELRRVFYILELKNVTSRRILTYWNWKATLYDIPTHEVMDRLPCLVKKTQIWMSLASMGQHLMFSAGH